MFVADNSLLSIKKYFNTRLKANFSCREIDHFFFHSAQKRLGLSAADLVLSQKMLLSESDLLFFHSIVHRLLAGEPLAYILGTVFFYDLPIKIDKRALIPRPETEELVDWIVKSHTNTKEIKPRVIVDIGTGSGCIALNLKKKFAEAIVWAIDKSTQTLCLAQENARHLQVHIAILQLDIIKEQLPMKDHTVDIMVSNPPYVLKKEQTDMQNSVLLYEPHDALFVEDSDPFIFYRIIIQQAKRKLRPKAWLYFEINEHYPAELIKLLKKNKFVRIQIQQDLQGKNRMIRGQLSS